MQSIGLVRSDRKYPAMEFLGLAQPALDLGPKRSLHQRSDGRHVSDFDVGNAATVLVALAAAAGTGLVPQRGVIAQGAAGKGRL